MTYWTCPICHRRMLAEKAVAHLRAATPPELP